MKKVRAFTLIEVFIIVFIISIVTVSMALGFGETRDRAEFKDIETELISLMQNARNLGFSSLYTDGVAVDYYELSFATYSATLTGYDTSEGTSTVIDSIDLAGDYRINSTFTITYTPPDGEISISDGSSSKDFTIYKENSPLYTIIRVSVFGGGYPEIVETN